jgi:molecular chaperone IbpA
MRIDFTPLYRTTVGFDRLFDMLDSTVRSDWPPYDIEKVGDDRYRISMAVAGFAPDEIQLTQQGADLLVTGQKSREPEAQRQVLHQGIAARSFRQAFSLADHVTVAGAHLENGLLMIELAREVPEQLKPRRIAIQSATPGDALDNAAPRQIEQTNAQTKAA